MADENKNNDELFTDDETGAGDGDGDGKKAIGDLISEASTELKDLGVMINADTDNCEEWISHLVTALKTHKATKGASDGGSGGGASIDDTPPAVEEQPQMGIAMSALQKKSDEQGKQLSFAMGRLADAELKNVTHTIDELRKSGRITPAKAKEWTDALTAKRLSLVEGADDAVKKILAQIEVAKDNPAGTFWTPEERVKLSHAHEIPAPDYVDDKKGKGKLDNHVMERMSGGRYKAPENAKK